MMVCLADEDLILCCNALIKAGLEPQSPLYEDCKRATSRNTCF